jgi:hypothetical protein
MDAMVMIVRTAARERPAVRVTGPTGPPNPDDHGFDQPLSSPLRSASFDGLRSNSYIDERRRRSRMLAGWDALKHAERNL